MPSSNPIQSALLCCRILIFRASKEQLLALNRIDLSLGLLLCWIVGIGRWWDDPSANLFLHLGLGSLIYPFVLGAVLWLFLLLLRPNNWLYLRLVTYISLTAPPAILYAIPVEKMYSSIEAAHLNVNFLCIVAAWRLALLIRFATRTTELKKSTAVLGAVTPILGIVSILGLFGLIPTIIEGMGGIREQPIQHGGNPELVATFTMVMTAPFLLLAYLIAVGEAWLKKKPQ